MTVPSAASAPFRIATTPFIYPDRWPGNVARLAGRVDDIEILLFELSGAPDAAELAALAAWKRRAQLTYVIAAPRTAERLPARYD